MQLLSSVMERRCRACKNVKPLEEFPTNYTCVSGRGWLCKKCQWQANKRWFASRPASWYRPVARKRCSKCKKTKTASAFGPSHYTKSRLTSQCRACHNMTASARMRDNDYASSRSKWNQLRCGARSRGLTFALTAEEYAAWWKKTPDACHYCGLTTALFHELRALILTLPSLKHFSGMFGNVAYRKAQHLTIDRRNSRDGYYVGNLAKACWICNCIKGAYLTEAQMKWLSPQIINEILSAVNGKRNVVA